MPAGSIVETMLQPSNQLMSTGHTDPSINLGSRPSLCSGSKFQVSFTSIFQNCSFFWFDHRGLRQIAPIALYPYSLTVYMNPSSYLTPPI